MLVWLFTFLNGLLLVALVWDRMKLKNIINNFYKDSKTLQRQFKQLHQENGALVVADLNFSKQLNEFTDQLISIEHQIQALENQRANDGGYQHALRILAMGGDKSEIINSCHLSPAEAELMMNLHAYQSALDTQSKVKK